jgi:hypothetical protein
LAEQIQLNWSQFGKKITDYRDCIQHYVPIDFGSGSSFMTRLQGGVWSVSFLIPDNPEARSQRQFKFEKQIDLLTYGWNVTIGMLDIASGIMNAVRNRENGPG